jgi:hypothetical protein
MVVIQGPGKVNGVTTEKNVHTEEYKATVENEVTPVAR